MDPKAPLFHDLEQALLEYDNDAAVKAAQAIVDGGLDVMAAVDVASAAINMVGDQFQRGDVFLPELMLAGETMKQCMAILAKGLGAQGGLHRLGKVVIGAVQGDIHDIGKNLVATQLGIKGFEVVDLGVNVPPMEIVERAEREKADVIALSALMTTSMPYQRDVINVLTEMGLRDKFFVIIGGGPVTVEFARMAGADGWAPNAPMAARLCERLVSNANRPPLRETVVQE